MNLPFDDETLAELVTVMTANGYNQEWNDLIDHIAELEAANAQQALTIHGYMKLEKGLRELAEKWRHEWNQVKHPYAAVRGKLECADDLEALLGEEGDDG